MNTQPAERPRSTTRCHSAHELLAAGVPLTLLLDLALPVDSHELYCGEVGSADWTHPALTA